MEVLGHEPDSGHDSWSWTSCVVLVEMMQGMMWRQGQDGSKGPASRTS